MTQFDLTTLRSDKLLFGLMLFPPDIEYRKPGLTHAVLAAGVGLVADVTDAAVAPSQVLTHAVLTDVRVQGTLVDV